MLDRQGQRKAAQFGGQVAEALLAAKLTVQDKYPDMPPEEVCREILNLRSGWSVSRNGQLQFFDKPANEWMGRFDRHTGVVGEGTSILDLGPTVIVCELHRLLADESGTKEQAHAVDSALRGGLAYLREVEAMIAE